VSEFQDRLKKEQDDQLQRIAAQKQAQGAADEEQKRLHEQRSGQLLYFRDKVIFPLMKDFAALYKANAENVSWPGDPNDFGRCSVRIIDPRVGSLQVSISISHDRSGWHVKSEVTKSKGMRTSPDAETIHSEYLKLSLQPNEGDLKDFAEAQLMRIVQLLTNQFAR
jgi:hypothetical protein